jgi:hypothetical protein
MRKPLSVLVSIFVAACCCKAPSGGPGGTASATASAPAAPSVVAAESPLAARIAKLGKDPTSEKSSKIETGTKGWKTYVFACEPSDGAELRVSVPDPPTTVAKWGAIVGKPKTKASDLAPGNGSKTALVTSAGTWIQITSGALAGSFAIDNAAKGYIHVATPMYIAATRDAEFGPWLCEKDLVPGLKHADDGDLRAQCKELVEKQLLSPKSADWPGFGDNVAKPVAHPDCSKTWSSYVDAKNAFGVPVRKNFVCSYDPHTNMVSAKLE